MVVRSLPSGARTTTTGHRTIDSKGAVVGHLGSGDGSAGGDGAHHAPSHAGGGASGSSTPPPELMSEAPGFRDNRRGAALARRAKAYRQPGCVTVSPDRGRRPPRYRREEPGPSTHRDPGPPAGSRAQGPGQAHPGLTWTPTGDLVGEVRAAGRPSIVRTDPATAVGLARARGPGRLPPPVPPGTFTSPLPSASPCSIPVRSHRTVRSVRGAPARRPDQDRGPGA